jgi:hypothetical protein
MQRTINCWTQGRAVYGPAWVRMAWVRQHTRPSPAQATISPGRMLSLRQPNQRACSRCARRYAVRLVGRLEWTQSPPRPHGEQVPRPAQVPLRWCVTHDREALRAVHSHSQLKNGSVERQPDTRLGYSSAHTPPATLVRQSCLTLRVYGR